MIINLEFYWIIDKNKEGTFLWLSSVMAFECEQVKVIAESRIVLNIKDNKKLIFVYGENCGEDGYWLDKSESNIEFLDLKCHVDHRDHVLASKIISPNGVIFEVKENYKGNDIRK